MILGYIMYNCDCGWKEDKDKLAREDSFFMVPDMIVAPLLID